MGSGSPAGKKILFDKSVSSVDEENGTKQADD
jgi:hypothetical protein